MSADVKRSNFNPFRTPTVSPSPTGASSSSASAPIASSNTATGSSDNIGGPSRITQPLAPPRNSASQPNSSSSRLSREGQLRQNSVDELASTLGASGLDDDAPSEPPPAYSLSANPIEGETTVEYGPTRPFQPAPPPPGHMIPPQQHFSGPPMHPQYSGTPVHYPQFTGPPGGMPFILPQNSGFQYMEPQPMGMPMSSQPWPRPGPSFSGPQPQRNPSLASRPPPSPIPETHSEFARDFYRVGTPQDELDERNARGSSPVSSDGGDGPESYEPLRQGPNGFSSLGTPSTPTSQSQYERPAGPPPSLSSPFRPPPGPPPQHPARTPSLSQNDFTPTTSPTPGRPLLHDGRILIYPKGHVCKKCSNTGYKQFDPSHPCRKCWEKYSKPYSAAMAYAPRSDSSQRPLPNFRPPNYRHSASFLPPPQPPSGADLRRTQSAYRNPGPDTPPGAYPMNGLPSPQQPGYPGGFIQQSPHMSMPMPSPSIRYTACMQPPPGATRVQPGDARIGGRLCWRCDGRGSVSFMIFDSETCHVCNGLGRTFN